MEFNKLISGANPLKRFGLMSKSQKNEDKFSSPSRQCNGVCNNGINALSHIGSERRKWFLAKTSKSLGKNIIVIVTILIVLVGRLMGYLL